MAMQVSDASRHCCLESLRQNARAMAWMVGTVKVRSMVSELVKDMSRSSESTKPGSESDAKPLGRRDPLSPGGGVLERLESCLDHAGDVAGPSDMADYEPDSVDYDADSVDYDP